MATRIALKHKESGVMKEGFYGFSWTTLFFGFFPTLFRGDFLSFIGGFVVSVIIGLFTFGIGALFIGLIWAFAYNNYYTRKLLERGYAFAGTESENSLAASALGLGAPRSDSTE